MVAGKGKAGGRTRAAATQEGSQSAGSSDTPTEPCSIAVGRMNWRSAHQSGEENLSPFHMKMVLLLLDFEDKAKRDLETSSKKRALEDCSEETVISDSEEPARHQKFAKLPKSLKPRMGLQTWQSGGCHQNASACAHEMPASSRAFKEVKDSTNTCAETGPGSSLRVKDGRVVDAGLASGGGENGVAKQMKGEGHYIGVEKRIKGKSVTFRATFQTPKGFLPQGDIGLFRVLGTFASQEEAARKVDEATLQACGLKYSLRNNLLNFPPHAAVQPGSDLQPQGVTGAKEGDRNHKAKSGKVSSGKQCGKDKGGIKGAANGKVRKEEALHFENIRQVERAGLVATTTLSQRLSLGDTIRYQWNDHESYLGKISGSTKQPDWWRVKWEDGMMSRVHLHEGNRCVLEGFGFGFRA